jgi:AraC-like DNA-binding protein
MPSSAIRLAVDPEEYRAAIRPSSVEFAVIERGRFGASLARIDLTKLWLQRGRETLPRIWHAPPTSERRILSFLAAGPSTVRNGAEFRPGDIAVHSPTQDYYHRSLAPMHWASMSLPVAEMAEISAGLAGCRLTPQTDEQIVTPRARAMARLLGLHAAAGHLARHSPEVIAKPRAARGLEQALIDAMVECLIEPDRREDSAAHRRHAAIMRRFHAALEASDDKPVYLPELCAKIGVSGRALRSCCHEHFGTGPKRYLLLRRMHLARRAMREAEGGLTSVTEIATQFGFWELGRFAVQYKDLFGESPSETLRQGACAPGKRQPGELRRRWSGPSERHLLRDGGQRFLEMRSPGGRSD